MSSCHWMDTDDECDDNPLETTVDSGCCIIQDSSNEMSRWWDQCSTFWTQVPCERPVDKATIGQMNACQWYPTSDGVDCDSLWPAKPQSSGCCTGTNEKVTPRCNRIDKAPPCKLRSGCRWLVTDDDHDCAWDDGQDHSTDEGCCYIADWVHDPDGKINNLCAENWDSDNCLYRVDRDGNSFCQWRATDDYKWPDGADCSLFWPGNTPYEESAHWVVAGSKTGQRDMDRECVYDSYSWSTQQNRDDTYDLAVTCCEFDGTLSVTRPECDAHPINFTAAVALCEKYGVRICTMAEMEMNVAVAAGCNYGGYHNWVSDECDGFIDRAVSIDPTNAPTYSPTNAPSFSPSDAPSAAPTPPTNAPTNAPTYSPTNAPTTYPTADPTADPTTIPTNEPTRQPTNDPTDDPTSDPTIDPTDDPTKDPTAQPTNDPTHVPTAQPTNDPTVVPTDIPSSSPTTPAPTHPGELSCGSHTVGDYSGREMHAEVRMPYDGDMTVSLSGLDIGSIVAYDSNDVQLTDVHPTSSSLTVYNLLHAQ